MVITLYQVIQERILKINNLKTKRMLNNKVYTKIQAHQCLDGFVLRLRYQEEVCLQVIPYQFDILRHKTSALKLRKLIAEPPKN